MVVVIHGTNGIVAPGLTSEDSTGTTTLTTQTLVLGGTTVTATGAELNFVDGVTSNLQTQLDAKSPLASPTFTGTPAAPTATAGNNTTQIATTAFVNTAVANLVDAAPESLNTLNELAAALGDDSDFSTTVTNSLALKAPLASPTFTGTVTINGTPVGRNPSLKSSNYTASNGEYIVATSGGITITLPAGPDSGDYVEIHDGTGAAATTNITVGRNGESITGAAEDFTLDVNYAKLHMVYVGGSVGWTV